MPPQACKGGFLEHFDALDAVFAFALHLVSMRCFKTLWSMARGDCHQCSRTRFGAPQTSFGAHLKPFVVDTSKACFGVCLKMALVHHAMFFALLLQFLITHEIVSCLKHVLVHASNVFWCMPHTCFCSGLTPALVQVSNLFLVHASNPFLVHA